MINLTRRCFFAGAGSLVAASALGNGSMGDAPLVKFGLFTDLHHADKDMVNGGTIPGKVYYRDGLKKMSAAIEKMNTHELDFLIELGDFKDTNVSGAGGKANALKYLREAEEVMAKFSGDRYHVLGNHDTDSLTKAEFLSNVSNSGQTSALANYTFVKNDVRFIVLDTNYISESNDSGYSEGNWNAAVLSPHLNAAQIEWLGDTVAESFEPCIVCSHHRLDEHAAAGHMITNHAKVTAIFNKTGGKVRAVLNGHQHTGGTYNARGVYYYNFRSAALNEHEYYEVEYYASGKIAVRNYV